MKIFGPLVEGQYAKSGTAISRLSLVTQKEIGKLHLADEAVIEKALASLQNPSIEQLSPYTRSEILQKIATLLTKHRNPLAEMITHEMGKPLTQARTEVDYTASYFVWFAEEAKRIYGMDIPSQYPNKRIQLRYEPIGPCAIISPWNFPIAMAGRKMAAAFAAGCPVIVKPSSDTPLSFLLFGNLCLEAGIPKEALQILVGNGTMIGNALMNTSLIRKLSFTGSCEVGKHLYQGSATSLKKLTMELGGHAPLLVFDDANLEKAVDGAIASKFRQSGQTCVCTNRFFIQSKIYPHFLKQFIEKVKNLSVGDPFDEITDLSFALHPASVEKTKRHIADAMKRGAKAHLQAKEAHEPEILTDVTDEMLIFNEETFGPVAGIATFKTTDEVLRRANQTPYGLAAYVFTEGLAQAEEVCAELEFGVIGLNDGIFSAAELPFGGIKASGFGREGGPHGIYEYLKEKVISSLI
ncbi:MAG: NAD-dependent succinate-semialdehyde dehydrogenase [Simkania sp.]|nr:NAD-dependent succinate-semialdehyde dehydrogenase [Simkania sp.]